MNERAPCPAVLLHVADRFLSYSEKAKGRILLAVFGVDPASTNTISMRVARREILAKVGQRGGQSQQFHLRRMQSPRDVVHVRRDFAGRFHQRFQLLA